MHCEETKIETLKVPFRQVTKSGCGSHSIANLFNDDRLIKGVEELTFGEGVPDLNKKLKEHREHIYVDVLFQTCYEFEGPSNRLTDPLVFKVKMNELSDEYREKYARPFLISVKKCLLHCILVLHNFKNDRYYIVDSVESNIEVVTLDELMAKYHIVSVEVICSWQITDAADRSIFIRKEHFTHLIPSGE